MSGQPGPIRFFAPNSGVEPCPGCKKVPQGGGWRVTVAGEWYSWHAACYAGKNSPVCAYCEERHPEPHDGSCLL